MEEIYTVAAWAFISFTLLFAGTATSSKEKSKNQVFFTYFNPLTFIICIVWLFLLYTHPIKSILGIIAFIVLLLILTES